MPIPPLAHPFSLSGAPPRPWDDPTLVAWRRLPMHSLRHRASDTGVGRVELDGEWAFELFPTPEKAFALPADVAPAGRLDVPGAWTLQDVDDRHGVRDLPWYTNIEMPFPDLPPHPPSDRNPTGVHQREMRIPAEWSGKRVVLHVGAAESVLVAEVDGVVVGVGKDSHLAAEFDITDAVTPGKASTLRLTVVKWSDASFIEDQDEWWHGGITRSVFLYATDLVHLADVRTAASVQGELWVHVEVGSRVPAGVPRGWSVRVQLAGTDVDLTARVPHSHPVDSGAVEDIGSMPDLDVRTPRARRAVALAAAGVLGSDEEGLVDRRIADAVEEIRAPLGMGRVALSATVSDVRVWSPETPELYDLTVSLLDPEGATVETTTYRIGFRTVQVVGKDLLVNGARPYVRGVNRHDFDPRSGRTVPADAMREDLLTMKRFGFNAIRTSHYPNDPMLLDLADELGFLVIDEADIECHAFLHHLSADPLYLSAWVDRVSRMVRRDVNHPSVTAWSLGNESGYGPNHDAAAGWVRRYDPTRPLHYEGAIRFDWTSDQTASDLTCPMYPTIESIVLHATCGRQRHPLVMCEYSHAMGNSNGTLADYWQAIESTSGLQGGFIWEFWDHGIPQRLSDGRPGGLDTPPSRSPGVAPEGYRWAYGGDFGEHPNDGNFVADGMVFPDRTPKPAMHEHRELAAPLRMRLASPPSEDLLADLAGGRLEVVLESWRHWRDTSDLAATWRLVSPSAQYAEPAALPVLPPGGHVAVTVPASVGALPLDDGEEADLVLDVAYAEDQPWAAAGTLVCSQRIRLRNEARDLLARAGGSVADASSVADAAEVRVDADGLLVHPLLAAGPRLSLWRAPTDNDRIGGMAEAWEAAGLPAPERWLVGIERADGRVVVTSEYTGRAGWTVRHVQTLAPLALDGSPDAVLVTDSVEVPDELTDLPRVGVVLETVAGLDRSSGYGPSVESYPDRRAAAGADAFTGPSEDWATPYLRPQETGGRFGVRNLTLEDADGRSLTIVLDEPRQVSVTRFRDADLAAARHHDELVPQPGYVIHLDAAHRGLGTASCGPDTLPEYLVSPGSYRWSYVIA